MINFNSQLQEQKTAISTQNRSFLYGDGVFETLKIVNSKVLFSEEHYFRLMASMRIVRMQIPMNFTLEFFETEILKTVTANSLSNSARARITVYRNEGGFYSPTTNSVSYVIETFKTEKLYQIKTDNYEVDLYKDNYIAKQLLSTLKTTNKILNVMASVFAEENDLQNCLLLNTDKNVVEAINGNVFILSENKLITPPISEGCLNGIMRNKILKLVSSIEGISVEERPISPFELQKADEIFITNVITGIQSITKYRKKEFSFDFAQQIVEKLNSEISSM